MLVIERENWDDGRLMSQYVPVSASLSWEKMEGSLRVAQDMYLLPLLGTELMDKLAEICNGEADANRDAGASAAYELAVKAAQTAVVCLALWSNYDALQLRLTDQGWQRQETETFKGAYKYQEDALKQMLKNRGFNAIDGLLDILERDPRNFPLYSECPAAMERKGSIVRSTGEVSDVVFINRSHVLFLRLLPELKTVEEMHLAATIGKPLYDSLKAGMEDSEKWKYEDCSLERFRIRCGRYLIRLAMIRLLLQTGSITDRGMYFVSRSLDGDTSRGASNDEIARQLNQMERDAEAERVSLLAFIRTYIPSEYMGDEQRVDRDNDGKRAFWA